MGGDVLSVISQTPSGMPPERFCICLKAFYEAGLLKNLNGDSIFASVALWPEAKADLENTEIILKLKTVSDNDGSGR